MKKSVSMQINLFILEVSEMYDVLPVTSYDIKILCFDFVLVNLLKNNFKIIAHVRKLFTTQLIII